MTQKTIALTMAAAGIVNTQAATMRIAVSHFMPAKLCTEPTPIIDPEMVCVVEIGIPKYVAKKMEHDPANSAQKPCTGFNLVNFIPIVFTIFQPPIIVPTAIAV